MTPLQITRLGNRSANLHFLCMPVCAYVHMREGEWGIEGMVDGVECEEDSIVEKLLWRQLPPWYRWWLQIPLAVCVRVFVCVPDVPV
jgi:hypothetical protein